MAALIQDLVSIIGKQFRLAFLRKTAKQKTYSFAWPAVLNCLAGKPFVYDKKYEQDYQLSLDHWAMKNKKILASFTLRDVQSRKPNEPRFQWHLESPTAQSVLSNLSCMVANEMTDISFRQTSTLPLNQGPHDPLLPVQTPHPWGSFGAGVPPPFASAQVPSSSSATVTPHWVPQMPPSIRPPHLKRTYDEAIGEGEAEEMEGVIQALAETSRQKKLRARETRKAVHRAQEEDDIAQREADDAQKLLDDAMSMQKNMYIAEKKARMEVW